MRDERIQIVRPVLRMLHLETKGHTHAHCCRLDYLHDVF
jgi:hypothetical protein